MKLIIGWGVLQLWPIRSSQFFLLKFLRKCIYTPCGGICLRPMSRSNKWKEHTDVLTMNLTDDTLFTQTESISYMYKSNEEDFNGKIKILNWSDTDYELYIGDCTYINSLLIRTHGWSGTWHTLSTGVLMTDYTTSVWGPSKLLFYLLMTCRAQDDLDIV